jgi:hypothetical protein
MSCALAAAVSGMVFGHYNGNLYHADLSKDPPVGNWQPGLSLDGDTELRKPCLFCNDSKTRCRAALPYDDGDIG